MSIPLRGRGGVIRGYALVDDADLELLTGRRWHLASTGYAASAGGRLLMHRHLLGLEAGDARSVWDRRTQRWIAQVYVNGRNHCVGRFDDEDLAGAAAAAARARLQPGALS